jgi:hypothetical protein
MAQRKRQHGNGVAMALAAIAEISWRMAGVSFSVALNAALSALMAPIWRKEQCQYLWRNNEISKSGEIMKM